MELNDLERFYQALDDMAAYFDQELSEAVPRLYLRFAQHVAIEAWEYACLEAMRVTTYHKLPLWAELVPFIETFMREERRRHALVEDPEHQRLRDRTRALAQIAADEALTQADPRRFPREAAWGQWLRETPPFPFIEESDHADDL